MFPRNFWGEERGEVWGSCTWFIFYKTVRLVVKKSRTIFTTPEIMFDVLKSRRYNFEIPGELSHKNTISSRVKKITVAMIT